MAQKLKKLEVCEISKEIMQYRKFSDGVWYVVSGSDQNELIKIFKKKQLQNSFNGGIYGSLYLKTKYSKIFSKTKWMKYPNLFI